MAGDRTSLSLSVAYAGEQVVRLGLAAVAGVFVARYLGPDGLGLLSYVSAVFGLLAPVATLGLPAILVREFSIGDDWRTVLASVLSRQVIAAMGVAAIGAAVVLVTRPGDHQALFTVLVLTPVPLLSIDRSFRAYLEARGDVWRIVSVGVVGAVVGAALKLLAIAAGLDVWMIAAAVTAETLVIAVGLAWSLPGRRVVTELRHRSDPELARRLAREGLPFLVSAVAVGLYMRVDVTMLGMLTDDAETGIYTAAARLSEVWYFLPMAALAAIRPRLSRLHERDRPAYERLLQRFMTASVATALVIVVAILLVGDALIRFLYGASYDASQGVLAIHVLAAPFLFVGVASGPWLVDRRMGRAALLRSSAGAVSNIVLNLVLLPTMGARGAAIATLVAYAVAGVILNGVMPATRPVFRLQLRAFLLRW